MPDFQSLKILISNDDGIDAPGIIALIKAMEPLGEVWVVAPDRERSATSHSISLHAPLRIETRGERRFAVDGTPTDCVYMAVNHLLPSAPDVVVSGVNSGANLGNDVLYSGTVSAAMEGALFGVPALAVSLCLHDHHGRRGEDQYFDVAAQYAAKIVPGMLQKPLPPGVLLNLNVPNLPAESVAGLKLCRLGFTDWADAIDERTDPRGRPYYWIGGGRRGHDEIGDSDNNAISAGFATITPIHYDLTDYRAFGATRDLPIEGLTRCDDGLGDEPLPHPVHPRATR